MEVMQGFIGAFKWSSDGSMFMWIIIIMGALGFAIGVERMWYLSKRADVNAPKFMDKVFKCIKANKVDEAVKICDASPGAALPSVIGAGLKVSETTQRGIQNAMDEATLEIIPQLEKRTGYINMIANVATMAGLTGTIYGLILCFAALAKPGLDPAQKAAFLASGISAAMFTTLAGLFVAIPLTMVFAVISNKTTKIIDEIDEHSVKMINLLGSR
jgi:biopolymer transport protein ExbB/TolQ